MKNKKNTAQMLIKRTIISTAAIIAINSLSGCGYYNNGYPLYYQPVQPNDMNYTEGDELTDQGKIVRHNKIQVPDSYYVGANHGPASHRDVDRSWVERQNSSGYTIELAEGSKPADVAKQLYQAPKNNRMAQVKYYKSGSMYYKGLYGSFNDYQSAKNALDSLPPEVRSKAKIEGWGQIQEQLR